MFGLFSLSLSFKSNFQKTMTKITLQDKQDLELLYERNDDPWGYKNETADTTRLSRLSQMLDGVEPKRTLDIGSGNGFVTEKLPGNEIIGLDISENAVKHAQKSALDLGVTNIDYVQGNLLEIEPQEIGDFDLICITGVLYNQYIGKSDYL